MFNSTVLDLVILLSFTYFIGSLLISSLQEIIATGLNMRAKELETALNSLLFDSDWQSFLKDKVLKSPFIEVLRKEADKFPSYIPAENFARAVMQQIGGSDIKAITLALAASPSPVPAGLKTVLDDFLRDAEGDVKVFQQQLETLYNTSMDRVTGWYKRNVRKIIFWLSFVVAILLNIDTIKIVNDSLKQPAVLKANVDQIASTMNDIHYKEDQKGISVQFSGKEGSRVTIETAVTRTSMDTLSAKVKELATLTSQLKDAGLKIGYSSLKDVGTEWWGNDTCFLSSLGEVFIKLLGVFITVCAFQLGSGYWFGILTKAVNIRGTGKKPGEKKSK
jgi:hypothetical protein